ncbi:MAG: glycerol-3-phosphate acyltransferase, partial [Actinobacteria bacterium]|nr:glycerol-3-phosphate acyltransferase [Actinomycetota bacterium]
MTWLLVVVAAYAAGMFPSAILVARAVGVDITSVGSGNPGAANITRNLGWKRGAWVFALDAAKGALGAGVGLAVDGRSLAYLAGAAAILGHCYPVT